MSHLHHKLIEGGAGKQKVMFLHGFPLKGTSWSTQLKIAVFQSVSLWGRATRLHLPTS